MSLIPREFTSDFFSPFFSTGALDMPSTLGQLANLPTERQMAVDVVETDKAYEVKADIPGVNKQDIKVTVDKDVLRLNVEKKAEKEEEKEVAGRKYHRWERSSTYLGRALRMPENANLDQVKAKYENGTLVLEIPKRETAKEAKRIDIA